MADPQSAPQSPTPRTKPSSTRHLFTKREADPFAITAPIDPAYQRRQGRRRARETYADWAEERTAHNYAPKEEL